MYSVCVVYTQYDILNMDLTSRITYMLKLSHYTPWWCLGGKEV
jgi:hypothetical protein